MNKSDLGLLVGGASALTLSAAGLIYSLFKVNGVAKKLDKSMSDISEKTEVEIREDIIEAAVRNAAEAEAERRVKEAASKAIKDISDDMSKQIGDAVNLEYGDLHEKVKARIEEKVNRLGAVEIRSIKRQIVDEAKRDAKEEFSDALDEVKENAKEKFENDLNDILERYNNQIKDVSRIYGSVASALGAK